MATKKNIATINYNATKNTYEIGFAQSPKKDTPEWDAKNTLRDVYLFHFYGGTLNIWCRKVDEISHEDFTTIKTLLKESGFKVVNNVGGNNSKKKNTKKTKEMMAKAIESQTITKPAPKKEEPKAEPVKEEPKPKKSSKKAEPKADNTKVEMLKQALEMQARLIAQIESL